MDSKKNVVNNNVGGTGKRNKNFSQSEVTLLLDLIDKKKNILECKVSDGVSQRDKDNAWVSIEADFNKQSGVYFRDWKALRDKYGNIKKQSKRKWAEERKYVSGTGGGPCMTPTVITQTDVKVREIIGDLTVCGKLTKFDCDQDAMPLDHDYDSAPGVNVLNVENMPMFIEEVELGASDICTPLSSEETNHKWMMPTSSNSEARKTVSSCKNDKETRDGGPVHSKIEDIEETPPNSSSTSFKISIISSITSYK